jgi:hypothetical protein
VFLTFDIQKTDNLSAQLQSCGFADNCAPRARVGSHKASSSRATARSMRENRRPLGTCLQEPVPNPLRLLWSKAMVVSAEGKGPGRTGSDEEEKAQTKVNQPMTCRKRKNEIKTAQNYWRGKSAGGTCLRPARSPAVRWQQSLLRQSCGTWEPSMPMQTESLERKPRQSQSTPLFWMVEGHRQRFAAPARPLNQSERRCREAASRGGTARSSREVPDKGMEPRGRADQGWNRGQPEAGGAP